MSKLAAASWLGLVAATGFTTFKVKYAVQDIEEELNRVRKHTIAEQQEARVLAAEWTYLTQPERLAELNRRFLQLAPVAMKQLQSRIEDLPLRPAPRRRPISWSRHTRHRRRLPRPPPTRRACPLGPSSRPFRRPSRAPRRSRTARLRRPPPCSHPAKQSRRRARLCSWPRRSELARRAVRADRREALMPAVQRIDENPCRPRHFRPPPPCEPVVADERQAALLETCRSRLVATAAVFSLVFLLVVLRLVGIVALAGPNTEAQVAKIRPPAPSAPPPPVRADILDRSGKLLATTLDSPSLYADPRQILDAREATKAILTVLPQLNPAELHAKLSSGKSSRGSSGS